MNISKILLATDGSQEAEKASQYAQFLARAYESSVTALYVNEVHFPLTSLFPMYEDAIIELAEKTEDKFKQRFSELQKSYSEQGIEFHSKIIKDGTVEGITKTAESEGSDLIVMGKSGAGFIAETILGSNTVKVLRQQQVPVLAVRSSDDIEEKGIKKILVPIDISDESVSPLKNALYIADKFGAEVIAVYVFWLNGGAFDIPPNLVDELVEKSKKELSKIVQDQIIEYTDETSNKTDVNVTSSVIHGISPAATLREYALQNSIDLVVVKTHGRSGLSRLVYGSETEKLIKESPCSVLAVK